MQLNVRVETARLRQIDIGLISGHDTAEVLERDDYWRGDRFGRRITEARDGGGKIEHGDKRE